MFRTGRSRRDELLEQAARLFADEGFAGVTVDDIGAACGVSGPALYHHFPGKEAMLGEMLVSISEHLVGMGDAIRSRRATAASTLHALVDAHADFATSRPDLIVVQLRDLVYASADDQRTVRRLQRRYVEQWVEVLGEVRPELALPARRVIVHGVFGLLNATPFVHGVGRDEVAETLADLAWSALQASGAGRPKR